MWRQAGLSIALSLAAMPALAEEPAAEMPGFMVGAWSIAEGGRWADEYWTPPRGGLMIGAGRSGSADGLDFWEHARIARGADGRLTFFAMPMGHPATEFVLVASDATMVEFANPGHDFPQRIRYSREGDRLVAEVSLMDGSRAQRWSMSRMGG